MKKVSICCSLRPLREKVAEGRMRGAVTGQPLPSKQGVVVGQALPDNAPQGHLPGFTLIELLVVVVIIAILAAIAVPQYKHAVLKSRFSTVMPMAKAIADAQEVYYQGRQLYALDVDELDVTPVNAENTTVSLSQTDGYDYVMAQNSQVPGANYIIYQKYSENYPSEIHCEAADDNEDAQWLCGVLSNNNSIGKTVTDGYTTYIINGGGVGFPVGYNALMERVDCTGAEALGFTCTSDAETGVKRICKTVGTQNICRTKTYNEDGSYTSVTCFTNYIGACPNGGSSSTYDMFGNKLTERRCSSVDSSGTCMGYYANNAYDWTYDAEGNKLTQRRCNNVDSNSGNCTEYQSGNYAENYDYTYDVNGNQLTQRQCSSVDSSGSCTAYYADGSYDYTYDANGNQLIQRRCSSVDSSGNCAGYSAFGDLNYTYDTNGNMLTERWCNGGDNNGNCTAYYNSGTNYTYDANGNMLTQRACGNVNSSGNCTSYNVSKSYDYTYDANGNQLTQRNCSSVDSSGNCTAYSGGYNYTYDANGKQLTRRTCSSVDSSGNCTAYSMNEVYTYDDDGKQVTNQYCSGSDLDTSTGECIKYGGTATFNQ